MSEALEGDEPPRRQERQALVGIDDALDATPKQGDIEGDQQTEAKARRFQVGQDLRDMDGCDALHRLELDYEALVHQKIKPRFADFFALVFHTDRHLASKGNAAERQFDAQCFLIDRLQKSRSEKPVYFDGGADHTVSKII